jgi:hypothetical protein
MSLTVEWKTIKFFLSDDGVDEVEASTAKELRCSCKGFKARSKCKHTEWCSQSLKDGIFPVEISKYAPKEAIEEAKHSHDAFRKLLIRWGKVETLP